MILYLDTSALVKVYVEEEGSALVRGLIAGASLVATSRIAYAEARAALARASREGALTETDYRDSITHLKADWPSYFVLEVTEQAVQLAGELAERHRLRGFDSLHLASAVLLTRRVKDCVTFACWDTRLWEAAKSEGFQVAPPSW